VYEFIALSRANIFLGCVQAVQDRLLGRNLGRNLKTWKSETVKMIDAEKVPESIGFTFGFTLWKEGHIFKLIFTDIVNRDPELLP
jgi:hypothetical protein